MSVSARRLTRDAVLLPAASRRCSTPRPPLDTVASRKPSLPCAPMPAHPEEKANSCIDVQADQHALLELP